MRPILFFLPFGLPLYGYGAMLCLSVIVGRRLALRLAKQARLDAALTARCFAWTMAGACIGARLLFVVTAFDQFDRAIDVFRIWDGGIVAYGGFLGGLAGAIAFCRLSRLSVLAWADCATPALCVGLTLTRIGCFLAGCDFGAPWNGAWAVRFPAGSPAFTEQMQLGLLPAGAMESLPVHPTQLYESLAGLALLGVVWVVRRRQRFAGQVLAAFTLGYGVLRYAIEVFRADPYRGAIGPLSTSQAVAAVTFVLASALWVGQRRGPSRSVNSDSFARV